MASDQAPAPPISPSSPKASPSPVRRRRWKLYLFFFLVLCFLFAGLYLWVALHWSYSDGERAGFVQKFSRKGWVCKTWEGELAMAAMPGAIPEIFRFTVRDKGTANLVEQSMGRRVSLHYEQHVGLPSSCFGETRYFVTEVQPVSP